MTTTVLRELAELRAKTVGRFVTVPVQLMDKALDELTDHEDVGLAEVEARIAPMQRELPAIPFAIYRLLMLAGERVVRNEVLRLAASRTDEPISVSSLAVHVHRLRSSLETLQPDIELKTVRGYGYYLSKKA